MPTTVVARFQAGSLTSGFPGLFVATPGPTDQPTTIANVSDNDDATYDTSGFGQWQYGDWDLSAVPSGVPILSVQLQYRSKLGATLDTWFFDNTTGPALSHTSITATDGGPVTRLSPAVAVDGHSNPWTKTTIAANLYIQHALSAVSTNIVLYDVALLVTYKSNPVTSAVTESGGLYPTIGWTFTDDAGVIQQRAHIKIFTAATVGGGGFDPEVSTAVWDSGEVFTSVTSLVSTTPIFAGSYYAYVKTSDSVPGPGSNYSAWASAAFTQVAWVPFAPIINSVTPDPSDADMTVVVRGLSNLLSWKQSAAEETPSTLTGANVTSITQDAAPYTPAGQPQLAHTNLITVSADGDAWATYARVPCEVNQSLLGMVAGRPSSGANRSLKCGLAFFRGDGSQIGSTVFGGLFPETGSTWMLPYVETNAPAGAVDVALVFYVVGGLAAEVHQFAAGTIFPGTHAESVTAGGWSRGGDPQSPMGILLERSADSGVTWTTAKRLFRPPGTDTFSSSGLGFGASRTYLGNEPVVSPEFPVDQVITVLDYEAPRGVAVLYRASVTSLDPVGDVLHSAPSASSAPATITPVGTMFKSVNFPNLNARLFTKKPGITASYRERQAVQDILGSSDPVVVFDVVSDALLSYVVRAVSAADLAAYLALQKQQDTVLIQAFDGRQWFCHLGPNASPVPLEGNAVGVTVFDVSHTAQEIATP